MIKAEKEKNTIATFQPTPPISKVIQMPSLLLDTTCMIDSGQTSWESIYELVESEGPKVIYKVVKMDATLSSEASNHEIASVFHHRIIA